MKRMCKENKKGFTLVEMVLVIAIIVILAAVMLIGIQGYIESAEHAQDDISKHNSETVSLIAKIEADKNKATTGSKS